MPRHHTVWDAESQRQIEVPFTAEEAEIDIAARDEQDEKFIALEAKLAEDSITYEELKELMRLRG